MTKNNNIVNIEKLDCASAPYQRSYSNQFSFLFPLTKQDANDDVLSIVKRKETKN